MNTIVAHGGFLRPCAIPVGGVGWDPQANVRPPCHLVSYNPNMSRPPFSLRLDSVRLRRLDQAAEREGIRPSEFVRRALDERIERVLGEPSALDYLGDYVGAVPGAIAEILDERVPPKDDFTAALLDDYMRQLAGRGKREWRLLDATHKADAVAAARSVGPTGADPHTYQPDGKPNTSE